MKEQITSALQRAAGDPKFNEALNAHFAAQSDLYTTCQKCKQTVKGTLTHINEHVVNCGKGS